MNGSAEPPPTPGDGPSSRRPPLGGYNPFYVALLALSTLFVVTIFAYLIVPVSLERATGGREVPPLALWLDDRGPLLLALQFAGMAIAGILAMLTDSWFRPEAAGSQPPR